MLIRSDEWTGQENTIHAHDWKLGDLQGQSSEMKGDRFNYTEHLTCSIRKQEDAFSSQHFKSQSTLQLNAALKANPK